MYYFRVYRSICSKYRFISKLDDGSCLYDTLDTLDNSSNEDCILPAPYTGNTGANMTFFLHQML